MNVTKDPVDVDGSAVAAGAADTPAMSRAEAGEKELIGSMSSLRIGETPLGRLFGDFDVFPFYATILEHLDPVSLFRFELACKTFQSAALAGWARIDERMDLSSAPDQKLGYIYRSGRKWHIWKRQKNAAQDAKTRVIKHCHQRPPARLAIDEDSQYLTQYNCLVRKELLEIIAMNDDGTPYSGPWSGTNFPGRVGFRCSFCKHVPPSDRVVRHSFFPNGLCYLYKGVVRWEYTHFRHCPHVPEETREACRQANQMDSRLGSKSYWVVSARSIGIFDKRVNGKVCGIVFDEKRECIDFARKWHRLSRATSQGRYHANEVLKPDDIPRIYDGLPKQELGN